MSTSESIGHAESADVEVPNPNVVRLDLYEVKDIPRMPNTFAHKPIPYVDDGVMVMGKFHSGMYGDVVAQRSAKPNLRVHSIVVDLETNKVVYRDHFNIFETELDENGKEVKTRVYVPHLKAKKIDLGTDHLCIYVRDGFFAEHKEIFSGNFNVNFEMVMLVEDPTTRVMELTFSRADFDLEADFNQQAFKLACRRNQLLIVR